MSKINATITLLNGLLFFCYSQGKIINVNSVDYRVKLGGSGKNTVTFENGMSDSIKAWSFIPDSIANYAKVFQYDRADIGKSGTSMLE